MSALRTMCFDIECTSLDASYGRILCVCAKFDDEKSPRTLSAPLLKDEKALLRAFSSWWAEADIVAGWNCVAPETPILTSDLTWVRAGDLVSNQQLVGFDEHPKPRRAWRPAIVESNGIRRTPCSVVTLSDGSRMMVSDEHPWLTAHSTYAKSAHRDRTPNGYRWSRTKNLVPGQGVVRRFFTPWQEPTDYDRGWLAGFLDGEGCLSHLPNQGVMLSFSQNPGPVLDHAIALLQSLGFDLYIYTSPKRKIVRVTVRGGANAALRALGTIRPIRLLNRLDLNRVGALKSDTVPEQWLTVSDVRTVGEQEVAILGTSTSTYIANGFGAHNSKLFDVAFLNARRMFHRMLPLDPSKKHIDLLYQSKKLRFRGNRLDGVSKDLRTKCKKYDVPAHRWVEAAEGQPLAQSLIIKHCQLDVLLTEEMLLRLKPLLVHITR